MGVKSTSALYPTGVNLTSHDGRRSFSAGKLVGGVFIKKCKPNHLMRTPPGIAIQEDIVEQLRGLGCRQIEVLVEDGRVFAVAFEDFLRHAFRLDRGFGAQECLPLKYWHDPNAPRQGELFEEAG
ncbi:MAG: hypothetical protein KBC96_05515 [Armatimonadetes bacterium]|nr:hypothetical protein [Armatimonadota bacterium]